MSGTADQHIFYNLDGTIRSERRKSYIVISDDEDDPVSRINNRDRTSDIPAGRGNVYVDSQACAARLHALQSRNVHLLRENSKLQNLVNTFVSPGGTASTISFTQYVQL
ncbi:hypothetical protein PILCRDRAFT_1318 [Piloderma croceum F 1598]|uniref:Uncharacterized protein n=1 Tax=Piloderma croceum (strain F 1598) TaxID=765440 RepID=A0A0C3GHJ3_PILCF|nr:hypothetical protein PILCRDRAFT_1318 [Piloderma croceum F 1598]